MISPDLTKAWLITDINVKKLRRVQNSRAIGLNPDNACRKKGYSYCVCCCLMSWNIGGIFEEEKCEVVARVWYDGHNLGFVQWIEGNIGHSAGHSSEVFFPLFDICSATQWSKHTQLHCTKLIACDMWIWERCKCWTTPSGKTIALPMQILHLHDVHIYRK